MYIEGKEFYIHMLLCIILFLLGIVRFEWGGRGEYGLFSMLERQKLSSLTASPTKHVPDLDWITFVLTHAM